ncbi:uncharacterized protein LOC134278642 [Saccostrea cucullata]|uniref:uncharacterized protein LOC134278642 n=1 Tax=Saccostrea cuccullata TaxID=36930 RepID=UPI002ED110C7
MAESFFEFLENNKNQEYVTSSPERTFQDFEEEWIEVGHNFSLIFDSGNSLKDPHKSPSSKKRKIEDAEDSMILNRKKFAKKTVKAGMFTQEMEQEEPLLKKFRQENPSKYVKLEKKMSTRDLLDTSFTQKRQKRASTTMFQETWTPTQPQPAYSPMSPPDVPLSTQPPPAYSPVSPPDVPLSTRSPPAYSPVSPPDVPLSTQSPPAYSPVSPPDVPLSTQFLPAYSPVSPPDVPLSTQSPPACSPVSPPDVPLSTQPLSAYSPMSPTIVPLSTQTQTSGFTPIEAPGFWNKPIQFPLKEELDALNELVDNVRMDLLQTSMLVNYIQEFMKKFQY